MERIDDCHQLKAPEAVPVNVSLGFMLHPRNICRELQPGIVKLSFHAGGVGAKFGRKPLLLPSVSGKRSNEQ
jgi:hypothetical protein